jgi:hypothetical protein
MTRVGSQSHKKKKIITNEICRAAILTVLLGERNNRLGNCAEETGEVN